MKNKTDTPCPIMNSLIHMGYLDYKKEWSKQEVQDALKKIKMSNFVAFLQTNIVHALLKNHNLPFTVKSLQTHNLMEHDASLSRKDDFLGDCVKFNKKNFNMIYKYFPNKKKITLKEFTEYRYYLYQKSLKENVNFKFDIMQYLITLGETCTIFILLSENDKLNLDKLHNVFKEETLADVKINSINITNLSSSYIKYTSYWVNASLRHNNK